jgi:hypothetical protein
MTKHWGRMQILQLFGLFALAFLALATCCKAQDCPRMAIGTHVPAIVPQDCPRMALDSSGSPYYIEWDDDYPMLKINEPLILHDFPFREPPELKGWTTLTPGEPGQILQASSIGAVYEWADPPGYWTIPDPPSSWAKFWAWALFGIEYR